MQSLDSSTVGARDNVWIVVAAYNEARRVHTTLKGLCTHYANIVVVDDGSSDGTFEACTELPVWRLRHLFNCGQGAALQTGISFALQRGATSIVTFDADGQHRPADIERLLQPIRSGTADIVIGSRFLGTVENLPWTRRLVLKLGVVFTRWVSRVQVTDTHNGLRALSRKCAAELRILENRMAHASEIIDQVRRRNWRLTEVPVTIHYSAETLAKGQSSLAAAGIVGSFLLGRWIR